MFRLLWVSIAIVLAGCGASVKGVRPPETVARVDIERYLGTWFEIARYPNGFQAGCHASTADYRLRPDGDIRVLNACRKGGSDGPLRVARGKAWVVDASTNAKLKVQFFWPFRGDYWIVDLGRNYEYAVVGAPDRRYLWVLARRPKMDADVYAGILERLRKQGFDTTRLIRAGG